MSDKYIVDMHETYDWLISVIKSAGDINVSDDPDVGPMTAVELAEDILRYEIHNVLVNVAGASRQGMSPYYLIKEKISGRKLKQIPKRIHAAIGAVLVEDDDALYRYEIDKFATITITCIGNPLVREVHMLRKRVKYLEEGIRNGCGCCAYLADNTKDI